MGFFDRLSKGWRMGIASLKIIQKNKQLVLFPIISGVALVLVIASFVGITYASFGADLDQIAEQSTATDYVLTFLYYLICYFVIVFFNVGLVHCTRIYLQGGKPNFMDGVRFSMKRIPTILGWAVLSATVGLLLKAIQENSGVLGNIIAGLIGVVWSIVTFFVVPVLAYEEVGPFEALKRSGKIMKEKWGESIGASFSFGILTLVAVLIIALPLGFIFGMINPILGFVVGGLAFFLIQSIVSSAEMVFIATVYHSVVDDQPVDAFDSELIDDLFVHKEKKGMF
ncbi:MAG: hypothetical protein GQ574_26155 [Crocinitomix sp.]|nr:hypothetical protein [Crocinitomix sp.]